LFADVTLSPAFKASAPKALFQPPLPFPYKLPTVTKSWMFLALGVVIAVFIGFEIGI
jgi:hypothetical protein